MKPMTVYEILSSMKHQKLSELHEGRGESKDLLYKGRDSATEDIIHGTHEVKDNRKAY